jgi:hypothetical protein
MSEDEKKSSDNDTSIYYVLGGVVLVAAVAGFFLLKPKTNTVDTTTPTAVSAPAVVVTPGPITKLACEKQYYNPVNGFPRYFLSVEAVDTLTTGTENCTFTISVKDKVIDTVTSTAELSESTSRGGGTFRCTTKAVEIAKGVTTKVEVKLENPDKKTATCSQNFIFP